MVYKITLTPSGAYFFGNEKRFKFGGSGNQYYISSETLPSQTTIMGAIRYTLLPEKGFDKIKTHAGIIGEQGFNMDSDEVQSFGKIQRLSSVFINKGEELFIPTPFDHNCAKPVKIKDNDTTTEYYTPMAEYTSFEGTTNGQEVYLADYDVKYGLADSFMSVNDCHIEKNLFKTDVRIGIDRKKNNDAFFKKAYVCLEKGFSFCVYAEIDIDHLDGKKDIVLLGQGKVPFSIEFEKAGSIDELYKKVENAITGFSSHLQTAISKIQCKKTQEELKLLIKAIPHTRGYCLSDMLLSEISPYDNTIMAIVKTRDFRSFYTNDGKYTRGGVLHRLVKAGSIFVLDDTKDTEKWYKTTVEVSNQQQNAYKAGFNQIIISKKMGELKDE